jgi:hypothetical protein
VKCGRKKALSAEQVTRIQALRDEEGMSVPDIAKHFSVGVARIYRSLAAQ